MSNGYASVNIGAPQGEEPAQPRSTGYQSDTVGDAADASTEVGSGHAKASMDPAQAPAPGGPEVLPAGEVDGDPNKSGDEPKLPDGTEDPGETKPLDDENTPLPTEGLAEEDAEIAEAWSKNANYINEVMQSNTSIDPEGSLSAIMDGSITAASQQALTEALGGPEHYDNIIATADALILSKVRSMGFAAGMVSTQGAYNALVRNLNDEPGYRDSIRTALLRGDDKPLQSLVQGVIQGKQVLSQSNSIGAAKAAPTWGDGGPPAQVQKDMQGRVLVRTPKGTQVTLAQARSLGLKGL
jgi:hypothetical protein